MTIDELLAKASPAPWQGCAHVRGVASCTCNTPGDVWDSTGERIVFFMGPWDPATPLLPPSVSDDSRETGYANGLLAVVMRSAFPEMLRALRWMAGETPDPPVRSLAAEQERARSVLDRIDAILHDETTREVVGLWSGRATPAVGALPPRDTLGA